MTGASPYRRPPVACALCDAVVDSQDELSMTDSGWACELCFKNWSHAQDEKYEKKFGLLSLNHPFWHSITWRTLRAILVMLFLAVCVMGAWARATRWRRIHRELEPDKYENTWPYAPKSPPAKKPGE